MTSMTLVELLERNAIELPEKTAIISHQTRISYRELNERVNRIANGLITMGLCKGDRVGFMLPRIPELVIGFLAVAKAQGVVLPINFELMTADIQGVLYKTAPRFLIVSHKLLKHACMGATLHPQMTIIVVGNKEHEYISWDDIHTKNSSKNPCLDIKDDDSVYLNITSGSSGNPKAGVTTHKNIYWNTFASVDALKLTQNDVHLCMFAPFAHPHELFARSLYLGGSMVLLEKIHPKSLAEAISDYGITCMMGLPPLYENLLKLLESKTYDLSSLRIPESGGMFTRFDLIERFKEKLGVPIIPVWGSTETTGVAIAIRYGGFLPRDSMGKPCVSYEVKIVDDNDMEVQPGEIGEIIFKGPGVVASYYNDILCNENGFKNGWYYSNDLGRRDEEGYYYFIERKNGMMKVAGLKVYPLEIEQVLLDHPDIAEAAVVSAIDRLRGEVPKAIIVVNNILDEKEVLAFCRKYLPNYKVPRKVEIRESLPKSGSGKINKRAIPVEVLS